MPDAVPVSLEILGSLLQGCDYGLRHPDPERNYGDYRAYLISCQEKLFSIIIPDIPNEPAPIMVGSESANTADMELYRLAALIYLGRAADSFGQDSSSEWVDNAFSILQRLETFAHPFPLLVFGLEATTDDQRLTLLELIGKTENSMSMRSLTSTRLMIQSIWVQDDLASKEICYMDRLSIALSSNEALPSLG